MVTKKIKQKLALAMSVALLLTACGQKTPSVSTGEVSSKVQDVVESSVDAATQDVTENGVDTSVQETIENSVDALATGDAEAMIQGMEEEIYNSLLGTLDHEKYVIENVHAIYVSKEYLEELQFNSLSNIYFGYTLEEVAKQFQGTKYVFGIDETGTTTVRELVAYADEFEKDVMTNVMIGTGIIIICVTISTVATAGVGTVPTFSMILSAPSTQQAIAVIGSGLATAISTGIAVGLQTEDYDEAVSAATEAGAQDILWNAIGGILGEDVDISALRGRSFGGLSQKQVAEVQKETNYPLDIVKDFKSVDIYNVCKAAGLVAKKVGEEPALVREVDPDYVDETTGTTNLERMKAGEAPLDPSGKAYQLYHIGKEITSAVAVLAADEYAGGDEEATQEDAKEFWKALANLIIEDALD